MNLIRIPKVYYDDHIMCEQEAPPVVKETKNHYYISGDITTLDDLYQGANWYSTKPIFSEGEPEPLEDYRGICGSARHTVIAIDKHRKEQKRKTL